MYNRKESQEEILCAGRETKVRKDNKERKQIKRTFQSLNVPPVHTLTATVKECEHFPHEVWSFPTGTAGDGMSDVS